MVYKLTFKINCNRLGIDLVIHINKGDRVMKNTVFLILLLSIISATSCTEAPTDDNTQTTASEEQVTKVNSQQTASNKDEENSKQDKSTEPKIDEYANTSLQSMFDFIAKTQKLKVNIASTFDTLQKSGQLIEFGGNSEWIIKRPNHVLINAVSWDGDDRTFYFDGKDITYYDSGYNVYAIADKEGDLDQAFDYFVDKLDMPLPLTELFSVKHPFDLKTDLNASMYLGVSTINGVDCNEFAYRFPDTDLQIWIKEGDQPLPVRIVITYKYAPGQPQYKAQFSDWDFTAELPDNLFKFTPPKDSRKIIFATRSNNTTEAENTNKGNK